MYESEWYESKWQTVSGPAKSMQTSVVAAEGVKRKPLGVLNVQGGDAARRASAKDPRLDREDGSAKFSHLSHLPMKVRL